MIKGTVRIDFLMRWGNSAFALPAYPHADINQMAGIGSGRMSYGSFSFEYGVNLRLQKQSTGQGSSRTKKEGFALQKKFVTQNKQSEKHLTARSERTESGT